VLPSNTKSPSWSHRQYGGFALGVAIGLGALHPTAASAMDPPNSVGWPVHGGTDLEQRFSPLGDVNDSNVNRLGLAWTYQLDTRRGQEATPIVVGDTLYFSTAWSKVIALNAITGQRRWAFDPKVPGGKAVHACCDVVNRGVAVAQNKVFVGTIDGRLIALDAMNGKPLWSVRTFDPALPYTITGAPRVVKGTIVIGNGGAELGVRGFVSAYAINDGHLVWRFYTVPGDPAHGPDGAVSDDALSRIARPTWYGQWWRYGGGGTVWDAIVYDPELNQIYLGVGNGGPWNRVVRSEGKGDNLFIGSVVALDADTGRYRWHYQETPGDSWDYTSTQPIILTSLTLKGVSRKVLLQAPKNGYFYVLDRQSGRLISAHAYVPMNWSSGIDPSTGRPIEDPNARYTQGPYTIYPSGLGGHSWHPMAFSPLTGLVYIPANLHSITYTAEGDFQYRPGRWNTGATFGAPPPHPTATNGRIPEGAPPTPQGELIAWDPVHQRSAWKIRYPHIWNGGVLATAGNLVFQGTIDGEFQAFRASDGTRLWMAPAGAGIVAGPITYRIGGVQYIAVLAGAGGAVPISLREGDEKRSMPSGRLLVYALNAHGSLPPDDSALLPPPTPSSEPFTDAQRAQGARTYYQFCVVCHGGYVLPDLRRSGAISQANAFKTIVLEGALESQGMASFRGYLSGQEAEAIRAYLNSEAAAMLARQETPSERNARRPEKPLSSHP
jgi:quinohemoprotein ethanol dehydrogenase